MLHLRIVSNSIVLYDADITQVTLPTQIGEITIMPWHIPLISAMAKGRIHITPSNILESDALSAIIHDGKIKFDVEWWLVHVENNIMLILTPTATSV